MDARDHSFAREALNKKEPHQLVIQKTLNHELLFSPSEGLEISRTFLVVSSSYHFCHTKSIFLNPVL